MGGKFQLTKKNIFLCFKVGLGLGLIVGAYALYQMFSTTSPLEGTSNEQVAEILVANDCMLCHSSDAEKPFYAIGPAGSMIEEDMRVGFRFVDLQNVVNQLEKGEPVAEVCLVKLRESVLGSSMPPLKYKAIHWASNINSEERQVLTNWIVTTREMLYPNKLAAEQFIDEPLKPLRDRLSVSEDKVDLGFDLFHDTRLSADNTISCATCHGLTTGGVDGLKTSEGIYGQIGGINAPTVYNSALNSVQFWDGRAADLQEQAAGPPLDMLEMGSTWEQITSKLKADRQMVIRFKEVYGSEGITQNTITDAIAEFEMTLLTPDSKFDKYLKGDLAAVTAEEIEGYELFKSNDCATCHAGENVGGISFDYMGVARDYFADRGIPLHDKDLGRIGVTKNELDKHRFKTPSLRNIELTAPYFHDGTVETLEEAVIMMAKYQIDGDMSVEDADKITLFLNTLTGENPYMIEK